MTRNYHTLDAILVCAAIILIAGLGGLLAFVKVPDAALPIIASLGTGVLGILTAYTGARWGNKKPSVSEEAQASPVVENIQQTVIEERK